MSDKMAESQTMKGKRVFLTGGARGIGRAIVETLLDSGARVVFCDVNEVNGKSTESQFQTQYGSDNVTFLQCDVKNQQQFTEVWQEAVRRLGSVDVCVNNAGIIQESAWETCIAVNQMGTIRGSLLAYNHMRKDKGGCGGVIINVASNVGLRKNLMLAPVYGATKHAIVGYTLNMASDPDMRARGVRWGALCPDAVDTPFIQVNTEGHVNVPLPIWNEILGSPDFHWLLPEDVAATFMTMLEDEEGNGDVMRVYKDKKGEVIRQVLANDTTVDPVLCSLVEKSHTAVAAVSTAGKISYVPQTSSH